MSLTNEDLNKIRNVVRAENELIEIRFEKLEDKINVLKVENKIEHQELKRLIIELKKMENEDTSAFYTDLNKLEKRVTKLEVKVA
ncbi:MAG: hypothetical protein ACD_58C00317G0019 [uncultured bacterium]|nr:MAG: hypothetical protein ACD_58C00317G0019 [uncultured bacterium]